MSNTNIKYTNNCVNQSNKKFIIMNSDNNTNAFRKALKKRNWEEIE